MTQSVLVEPAPGGFKATPVGIPDSAVVAPTRDEALRAVAEELAARLAEAEVVEVETPAPRGPLAALVGILSDDPELARRICEEAYAERDAHRDQDTSETTVASRNRPDFETVPSLRAVFWS